MNYDREEAREKLAYALVRVVELRIALKAIEDKFQYGDDHQQSLESSLNSVTNIQVRLINTLTLL